MLREISTEEIWQRQVKGEEKDEVVFVNECWWSRKEEYLVTKMQSCHLIEDQNIPFLY